MHPLEATEQLRHHALTLVSLTRAAKDARPATRIPADQWDPALAGALEALEQGADPCVAIPRDGKHFNVMVLPRPPSTYPSLLERFHEMGCPVPQDLGQALVERGVLHSDLEFEILVRVDPALARRWLLEGTPICASAEAKGPLATLLQYHPQSHAVRGLLWM